MANDHDALEKAFSVPMEFGTAGMRGILGPGINCMNIYTVRQATEGLAQFMKTLPEATKKNAVWLSVLIHVINLKHLRTKQRGSRSTSNPNVCF